MTKTDKEYEQVFKQLMRYSKYADVSEIKTQQDLYAFFHQVDSHPATQKSKKGHVFSGNKNEKLRGEMKAAAYRLRGKGDTEKVPAKNPDVLSSRNANYASAAQRDAVVLAVTFRKGKETPIRAYKDRSSRWRDHKGRYVKIYIEL